MIQSVALDKMRNQVVLLLFTLSVVKSYWYGLTRHSCAENHVQCDFGYNWRKSGYSDRCIEKSKVCNKQDDCSDGSDEKYCPGNYNYKYHGFAYRFVQGPCSAGNVLCPTGEGRLTNTHRGCITQADICDTAKDCKSFPEIRFCKSESTYFEFNFNSSRCPHDYFRCRSGSVNFLSITTRILDLNINDMSGCLNKKYICDGKENCEDGSDEHYCPYFFLSQEINSAYTTNTTTASPLTNATTSPLTNTTTFHSTDTTLSVSTTSVSLTTLDFFHLHQELKLHRNYFTAAIIIGAIVITVFIIYLFVVKRCWLGNKADLKYKCTYNS